MPRGRAWEAAHLAESDRADPGKFTAAIQGRGYTYQDLADVLSAAGYPVPKSTLNNIGLGRSVVSRPFARRIEQLLGVEPGAVFTANSHEEAT
jgi:hypothetical protein